MPSYDDLIENSQPFNPAKLNLLVTGLLIILCTWAGIVNSSLVLISAGLFLLFKLLEKNLKPFKKLQTETLRVYLFCLFFLVSGAFTTLAFAANWANLNPVAYFIVSLIGLGVNLLVSLALEKKPITKKLFQDNLIWVLLFIIGLVLPFFKDTKIFNLDLVIGLLTIFYLSFLEIKKIYSTFNLRTKEKNQPEIEETETAEIDELILREIFKIDKILKLIGFEICVIKSEIVVIGNIVVDNKTSQEEIFELKQKAKAILKRNKYTKAILDVQYEVEYENAN